MENVTTGYQKLQKVLKLWAFAIKIIQTNIVGLHTSGWFGVVQTALVTSTKLSYVEPG